MGGGNLLPVNVWLGIDMGSSSIKGVLAANDELIAGVILPVVGNYRKQAERVMEMVVEEGQVSVEDVKGVGVTGVGSEGIEVKGPRFSEVAAHIRGVMAFYPHVRTVIDIGSQFTRAIVTDGGGKVRDFIVSEKCATGSGRFLQIMARILHIDVSEMGPLSLKALHPVEFSTGCAVFAESEAISRIAEGAKPEDIVAGVHRAMASKVEMLMRRVKWEPPVALVGGGGEDTGLLRAIEEVLKINILVPLQPRLMGAFGAACLAANSHAPIS